MRFHLAFYYHLLYVIKEIGNFFATVDNYQKLKNNFEKNIKILKFFNFTINFTPALRKLSFWFCYNMTIKVYIYNSCFVKSPNIYIFLVLVNIRILL